MTSRKRLQTMQIFLQKMFKNTYLQQVILLGGCQRLLRITCQGINNASFRQILDPIKRNILRRQNPLELIFEDISTFDAENPIVGSLLRELDSGKRTNGR